MELFELWDKIYVSYHKDDLHLVEVDGEHVDNTNEILLVNMKLH